MLTARFTFFKLTSNKIHLELLNKKKISNPHYTPNRPMFTDKPRKTKYYFTKIHFLNYCTQTCSKYVRLINCIQEDCLYLVLHFDAIFYIYIYNLMQHNCILFIVNDLTTWCNCFSYLVLYYKIEIIITVNNICNVKYFHIT